MKRSLPFFFLLAISSIALPRAAGQPYRVDTLASGPQISFPVAIAFVPGGGGAFFFTEKNAGRVRTFTAEGTLEPTPFATIGVTGTGEQGLLGVALHPSYPDSPFVYVFFTRSTAGGGNRDNLVVRYRDSLGTGVRPDTILVVPRNNSATNHNGGNVHFGPDGKLYVTIGDYAVSANAQDSAASNLRGKILRLNPDGSVPPDNPFAGTPFWSIGHRNSFDFTFDPLTEKMYCTENGPACNDEVNRVPPGGNMGWPVDGNCAYGGGTAYVRPLYRYPSSPLPALTGIVVYRGEAFPRLRGRLLFAGNSAPVVWSLELTADGDTIISGSPDTLFTYATGFADVAVGPDGNIYLANGPYGASRLLRLRPVAPAFAGAPPAAATQDMEYVYTPGFSGTPPGLSLLTAPDGMAVDSAAWTLRWTPTNAQALAGVHAVTVRASNGAGTADQSYTVTVANVNDPPGQFDLLAPPNDTALTFTGVDPQVALAWGVPDDPDLDPVEFTVQLDTSPSFSTPALLQIATGTAASLTATLPRASRAWYWRVRASDGQVSVASGETRRLFISFVTGVRERGSREVREALEQNFPNPFNPLTSIKYTIPKGGIVRLAVFNLLGQEVALLFEGEQSAGTYEVSFEGAGLPTGIYLYRIQAPGFVETKKMTIAK